MNSLFYDKLTFVDSLSDVDSTCWVVIPLFNEEAVIGNVIEELKTRFNNVVCVDDGSSDNSAFVAEHAGAVVIRHPINLGQGAALQTGISFARSKTNCDFIITFDADGQHQLADAIKMVELAREQNLGMVFGSRFLDGKTKPGLAKKIILKTAVWASNLLSPIKLTDAHNGLRVISKEAALALELQQDRMAHASEIVLQLGKTGLPWKEYPVQILYTEYSKSKGQPIINAVNILVELIVK